MNSITFIDTEIEPGSARILDLGGVKDSGTTFHKTSVAEFVDFLKGTDFICGHNIFRHDLKYIGHALTDAGVHPAHIIDTLYLSPLLFPAKPYHALVKDDKLQTEETNNPLNDSIKVKDLFHDEVAAFIELDEDLRQIFYSLLKDQEEFRAFFRYVNFTSSPLYPEMVIRDTFPSEICKHTNLTNIISAFPVELAYCLSLIHSFKVNRNIHSITPRWVLKNYPDVERIMLLLRNKPCLSGCEYCNRSLDIHRGLKRFFGFDSFRTFGGEPLQEKAVLAAVNDKSILTVFPTGGGKSITFQTPALMSVESVRGLTVVISPLQSLMKDQVDNLEKAGITDAVTINGLLDPIERAKSFERVEDGSASILYISPESLRSRTIERLILGRNVVRFVIDEAHCFSSWGQDFRVDYMYIGDFIRKIQEKKQMAEGIPVSCFTATAKQKVIEDIRDYFREKLDVELELFTSRAARTNLQYKVFEKGTEEDKYQALRDLIDHKQCPTIVYVSRTRQAFKLADRLTRDGFPARPYHGKMDSKEKSANQDDFISGKIPIIVATSAFGMGVDKKDVGLVVHYEISDSLENYIQEAGRAGRDENIVADCYVLYDEEDLSKHFILLNQTKLTIGEIQQVWKAIKGITRFRSTVSNSALEIARKAGWDDNVMEIETRVTTAIAALEDAGYLRRGQNIPRIFANSILTRNAQEAIDRINASPRFEEKQKIQAIRIIKKLFSSKSRKSSDTESAESRVDYISDHLGILREEVINIVNLLREENILADAKDLTAFIQKVRNKNRSLHIVEVYSRIENFLISYFEDREKVIDLKELNQEAEAQGLQDINITRIKTIINFWAIKNWIKRKSLPGSKNHIATLRLQPEDLLREKLEKRHILARFIVEFLYSNISKEEAEKTEILVEFSVLELKSEFESQGLLFKEQISIDDIEDTLFYLSRIEAIKIEGGFLVIYNRLTIERLEEDNYKRYTKEDYSKLNQFYESKVQQIHIVGEYAKKMLIDYQEALQFVEDYFQLNYGSFLRKYFPGSNANHLQLKMTPRKFRQLFGELSPTQLKIINDNESKYIAVAAGPDSGKTRVLVHKLASLLLMEDVKHDQLLMLTFSRAAATEFKKRLIHLIGNAANFIEIKTFHSYCFDLSGKVGTLEKSDEIIKITIEKIKRKEVEVSRMTKTVLVIDEAQDMDKDEYGLIRVLMDQNTEMRVIAVGDDDQNIYEFRGSSSKYLEQFIRDNHSTTYELVENYRSKANLVAFTNQIAKKIQHRMKDTPIMAHQTDFGKITLVRHYSENLIVPVVNDILASDLTGTTGVLTRTNEEALQITSLLVKNGVQARLIQANDKFNLYDLAEVRYFLSRVNLHDDVYTISERVWEEAQRDLNNHFLKSTKLELLHNIINDFEATNPRQKYKSDLEVFIRESRLEDFINASGECILVSTMHKAKGREFDQVYLLLENFNPSTDADRRLLYVAMTRAKHNLTIHLNSSFLDQILAENLVRKSDRVSYSLPSELVMHLTHKDIWLDYFSYRQEAISQLVSGDELILYDNGCLNSNRQPVLKFSRQFVEQIEERKRQNYHWTRANVNFIVHWENDSSDGEIKIILPELFFERKVVNQDIPYELRDR